MFFLLLLSSQVGSFYRREKPLAASAFLDYVKWLTRGRVALQQHRFLQQIFAEQAWLATLIESISDGIIATDPEATVCYLNAAGEELLALPAAEAVGAPIERIFDLSTPAGKSVKRCPLRKAIAAKTRVPKEAFILRARNGQKIPIENAAAPIMKRGAVIGAVSIFRAVNNTLCAHLLSEQEDERRRLARELHNDLGQRTALLDMSLERLSGFLHGNDELTDTLQKIRKQTTALSERLREMSHMLHPAILSDLGLVPGLRSLVEDFRSSGMRVQFDPKPLSRQISIDTSTALYRIAQETLRDIEKHAPESLVRVTLSEKGKDVQLCIEDSGPARGKTEIGLLTMQERARNIGGSLLLRTTRGKGNRVLVRVPLEGLR